MKLKEIMTKDVQVIHPDETLQMAAQKMRDHDIGFLPVCEGDRLVGTVTDRDLALRGVAAGINSKAMAVLSRDDKRLVGVVSLGDIANNGTKELSAEVLQSVSEPA